MKAESNNKPVSSLCVDILNTFSEKELKKIKEFTSCQYFNTNQNVVRLLEILKRRVIGKRNFDTNMRDSICAELFSEKFSSVKNEKDKLKKQRALFNVRMNDLQKLAEKFLSIQTMENDTFHEYELLAPQLISRKLFKLFKQRTNKNKEALEQKITKEQKDYKKLYKIEYNLYEFLFVNDRLSKEDNLQQKMYNLDVYSVVSG